MIPFQRKDQTSVPFWNKLKYFLDNIFLCWVMLSLCQWDQFKFSSYYRTLSKKTSLCGVMQPDLIWSDATHSDATCRKIAKFESKLRRSSSWTGGASHKCWHSLGGSPLKHVVKMLIEYLIRINSCPWDRGWKSISRSFQFESVTVDKEAGQRIQSICWPPHDSC